MRPVPSGREEQSVDEVRAWVDAARGGGRPHRRRHLDRQRHPRLPGPERRLDEEPEGRADGPHQALRGRPRGPAALVAAAADHPAWTAQPNAGHRALVDLERRGKLHTLITQNIDGMHQAAGSDPALVVEVHGTVPRGHVHVLRRAGADGAGARPGAGRRGRPAVPQLRRHPQVGHRLVRPDLDPGDLERAERAASSATSCSASAPRSPSSRSPRCRTSPQQPVPGSWSSTPSRPRSTTRPTPCCGARSPTSCPAGRRPGESQLTALDGLQPTLIGHCEQPIASETTRSRGDSRTTSNTLPRVR